MRYSGKEQQKPVLLLLLKTVIVLVGGILVGFLLNYYVTSEIAAIYPITPSSPMAEKTDEWSANGRKNLFGQPVSLVEMQSEAGAIGAVHGALEAGSLATSFTSSQGLMLMIPVLHRISGTRQTAVLHVASRPVGTHAMSIFGDHSDVMNCRQTGFAQLSTGSVQEVMDLAGVAHLCAVKARIPFMHFFDGFRTSHEIQKVRAIPYEAFDKLLDKEAVKKFRAEALNPNHPTLRNTVQNPDVYFQFREANNTDYDALPALVETEMQKINALTGEDYHVFNYFGAPDAERVIVAMGSVSGTVREAVKVLNAAGEKLGFLQVHLFNPFSAEMFRAALPASVKKIAVLDRCKEMGAAGDPLYLAVCAAFANRKEAPYIIGGRYGLSSKDTTPEQIAAVFEHLKAAEPWGNFTIGIHDDVTRRSLPIGEKLAIPYKKMVACKFWGLGSDGTVGANKNSIKIIGENTDMYTQAYFEYDTKKSFGITRSHLRFGEEPIIGSYLVTEADFVACHNQSFIHKYDIVSELKPGGTFLLDTAWEDEGRLEEKLPAEVKRQLAEKKINFYVIDAHHLARNLGLGNHASMVLQSAFFALADIIPMEDALGYMKKAAEKTFGKKGEEVVRMNLAAIDAGKDALKKIEIPESWLTTQEGDVLTLATPKAGDPPFIRNILRPINALKGDELPVSTFVGYADGTMPLGTTAYEKRGIATQPPRGDPALSPLRGRKSGGPGRLCDRTRQRRGRPAFLPAVQHHGLHRLRLLRGLLPAEGQGSEDGACNGPGPAYRARLGIRPDRFRKGCVQERHGERQPVQAASVRVLRGLCRLRGNPLCQAADSAVRRPDVLGQCHRLHPGLGRCHAFHSLYLQ